MDLIVQTFKRVILIIVKLLGNRVIIKLKEILALLITSFLILQSKELIFISHLLLKMTIELIFDLSYGRLVKQCHSLLLHLLVSLLELNISHGALSSILVIEFLLKISQSLKHGLLALILADVRPR